MTEEPSQERIDRAFDGTNFGLKANTPEGRKELVAECVLKRACGFSSGSTIEAICKQLGLMTEARTPRKYAKMWAYMHLMYLRHNN